MSGRAFLRKQYDRMFRRRVPVVVRRVSCALAVISLFVSLLLFAAYGIFDRKPSIRLWSARFSASSMFLLATSFFVWCFDELIARPYAIFHWSEGRILRVIPDLIPDEDNIALSSDFAQTSEGGSMYNTTIPSTTTSITLQSVVTRVSSDQRDYQLYCDMIREAAASPSRHSIRGIEK